MMNKHDNVRSGPEWSTGTINPEWMAVVVLNYNKKSELLDALRSVRNIHYGPFEVVVVDAGSTDGSGSVVSEGHPEVRLV